MTAPKPSAPKKPLTFTPPQYSTAHPRQSAKKLLTQKGTNKQVEVSIEELEAARKGSGIVDAIMLDAFRELQRDFPEVVAGLATMGEEARKAAEIAEETTSTMDYYMEQEAKKEKPTFERKPHLTQRPFVDSPEMRELQKKLNQEQRTRRPRFQQR